MKKSMLVKFPARKKRLIVEVFYQQADPPQICGISGAFHRYEIDAIEDQIQTNPKNYFNRGDGCYLFEASFYQGEYDNYARCEASPCWNLDLLRTRP